MSGRSASLRGAFAFARAAARQVFAARVEVLARAGFYVVILLIYARVWRAALGVGESAAADLLWYLAATEWVLLSVPLVHLDLERDVRQGDVAVLLVRPVPWLARRVSEALGQLAARMLVLGITGFVATRLLAGAWPHDPRGLPVALVVGVGAGVLGVLAQAAIGMTAVWTQDVAPLYWIWQKAAFLLGGLVLPLSFYPDWLRTLARWTPFASFLYGPGRLAMGLDGSALLDSAMLVVWIAIALAVLATVHRRALRVLDVHGG